MLYIHCRQIFYAQNFFVFFSFMFRMLKVFLDMDKQYKYKNIGCKEEFKYRIQVIRHATRRKKPKPVATEKNRHYYKQDHLYCWTKCNTNYIHVQNICRHKCSFSKPQFKCSDCGKVFKFKSRLTAHKKVHKRAQIKHVKSAHKSSGEKIILMPILNTALVTTMMSLILYLNDLLLWIFLQ